MSTNDQRKALRECPFCGGCAIRKPDPGVLNELFGLVVDHTPGCFLSLLGNEAESAVDAAWNTRAHRSSLSRSASEAVAYIVEMSGVKFLRHDPIPASAFRADMTCTPLYSELQGMAPLKDALRRATENSGDWMREAFRLRALLDDHNIDHRLADLDNPPPKQDENGANDGLWPDGFWPRICMCNQCGHTKTFATRAAIDASPICDRCGEHALDGSGYCWCGICGASGTPEGGAA